MSIYAINLLGQLVAAGHDVTMISQYYGDPEKRRIYGGGPPPPVAGVRVIGLEALGEQDGGDFERDIDAMVAAIAAEHAAEPFDVLHAQYGYPTGWATLIAAQRLGVPCVVSIQGGDGHWVGSCCDTHRVAMEPCWPCRRAADRRRQLRARGARPARLRARPLHHRARRGRYRPVRARDAMPAAHPPALSRPGRSPERRARHASRAGRSGRRLALHRLRRGPDLEPARRSPPNWPWSERVTLHGLRGL